MIEVFVGAKRVMAQRTSSYDRHPSMPEDMMALFWMNDPSEVQALPFLMLVPPAKVKKISALVTSMPGRPFPFSATTRIVPVKTGPEEKSMLARRRLAVRAVAGLTLSEISFQQGNVPLSELSLSSLKTSFPFVFGRVLNCVGAEALNGCLLVEKDVRKIVGDVRSEDLELSERAHFDMLSVAYQVASNGSLSDIGEFCNDLVDRGEASDAAWLKLAGHVGWKVPISQVSRMNREDRLGCFLELNRIGPGNSLMIKEFCSAYLASLISPGTFDHLDMVKARASRETVSWYGFVAGLQRGGAAVQSSGSVSQRLIRDMSATSDIYRPTEADVAANELFTMDSRELQQLWRFSICPDCINVEIHPGLSMPFYIGQPRSSTLSEARARDVGQMDLLSPNGVKVPDSLGKIEENISEVVKLLSEVVSLLPAKEKLVRSRVRVKSGTPRGKSGV